MRVAIVRNTKTGEEGHIFYFNDEKIDNSKQYWFRIKKCESCGYSGKLHPGNELEIIAVNKNQLQLF